MEDKKKLKRKVSIITFCIGVVLATPTFWGVTLWFGMPLLVALIGYVVLLIFIIIGTIISYKIISITIDNKIKQ